VSLKKTAALLIAVALLAGAGLVMAQTAPELSLYREEHVSSTRYPGGQEMTTITRTWIKGDKMRTEADEGNDITIVRPDLGKVFTINTKRRIYSDVPLSTFRRGARLSLALLGHDPTYRFTNRKKKIGKWNSREVVLSEQTLENGDRLKTVWWVSDEVKIDLATFKKIMQITAGPEMDAVATRFFSKLDAIGAYPVRAESTFSNGGSTVKTVNTLRVIEPRTVADDRFELPTGLTKMVIPLPGELQ
jgi:hypothetical protein